MGKKFSSMIKGKRFRNKKILSHSPLLPSNFWMGCVRTHTIMKRGGHLDSWGRAWRPSWLMRESVEAILTHEGERGGHLGSWGRAWRPSWLMRESVEAILTHEGERGGHLDSWGRGQGHCRLTEPVPCYQWDVGLCWLIGFHCWFFLITLLSSSFSELPSPFPLFFSSYPLHIFNAFEAGMVWVKNTGHTGYKDTGKATGP